jgi:hypothetical protein
MKQKIVKMVAYKRAHKARVCVVEPQAVILLFARLRNPQKINEATNKLNLDDLRYTFEFLSTKPFDAAGCAPTDRLQSDYLRAGKPPT